jgi:hypothetical protein
MTCGTSDPECAAIARVAFVLPGIGIGAAAGALIDYSLKKFDTVFAAPGSSYRGRVQLTPVVSRDQRGLRLSIPF